MRASARTIASTLAACLWAGPAQAEDQVDSALDAAVDAVHFVRITMDHGHARMHVRRMFSTSADRADRIDAHVELPPGGVANGLRLLVDGRGEKRWVLGRQTSPEAAEERFSALTSVGTGAPQDAALLSFSGGSHVRLSVFPVRKAVPRTVEYTALIPTTYASGREALTVPPLGTKESPADIMFETAHGNDQLFLGGARVVSGTHRHANATIEVSLVRARPGLIEGRVAAIPMGPARSFFHARFETPLRLSEVPSGARVVVVLDASRSIAQADAEAMRGAASSYLAHMGNAEVEVLTFDRAVAARHGQFVSKDAARRDLDKIAIGRRNGSNFDIALARAAALLAAFPEGTPTRIVMFTDLRTKEALTPTRLGAILGKSRALVHIATVRSGAANLFRDDVSPWAKVTRPTGGLVWSGHAGSGPMAATFEELARPKRIDRLTVQVSGGIASSLGAQGQLDEGDAIEETLITPNLVPFVAVSGELWATRVGKLVVPDDAENRRWAVLAGASSVSSSLTPRDLAQLSTHGPVVSLASSLLATAPGGTASTDGLEEAFGVGGLSLMGIGESGGGGRGGIGTGSGRARFDGAGVLRDTLGPLWRGCGGVGAVDLSVETTLDEIVAVDDLVPASNDARRALPCLEEATWSLGLPPEFRAERAKWTVRIPE